MLKRGQAAMEFLMTYGWAIIAVLLTIAALAYFGVLNPSLFLPESCTLFPGLACTDFVVTNTDALIGIRNGLGQSISTLRITVPQCSSSQLTILNGLQDGEEKYAEVICSPSLNTNDRVKSDISIEYTINVVTHTRQGKISTIVSNNLVKNYNFENWFIVTLPNLWTNTLSTYRIASNNSFSGKYSVRQDPTAENQPLRSGAGSSLFITIDPSKSYLLCAHYKLEDSRPVEKVVLQLETYDASAIATETCCQDVAVALNPTNTNWQQLCGTRSIFPAGTTQVRIRIVGNYNTGNAYSGVTVLDNVIFKEA